MAAMEVEENVLNQELANDSLNLSKCSNTDFDTDEEDQDFDTTPLSLDWVDLTEYKLPADCVAISSLPGCRYSKVWRSIDQDIEYLKSLNITSVIVFCTKGDLFRFRSKDLLQKYEAASLKVFYYPHGDSDDTEMAKLLEIFNQLELDLNAGKKTLMHCNTGLGQSCLVAASFMMYHDPQLEPLKAIEKIRSIRGHGAIETVKQYNFINEFRQELKAFLAKAEKAEARAVSR